MPARLERKEKLIAKYGEHTHKIGSIFTRNQRLKLLGIKKISARNQTWNDFRQDIRDRIKMGLIDLELFLETAGEDQIKQVLTEESLRPLIISYFHTTGVFNPPDLTRAKVARLFIEWGFSYLGSMKRDHLTFSHSRTIREAQDLANYLSESFKPESERRYSQPNIRAIEQR